MLILGSIQTKFFISLLSLTLFYYFSITGTFICLNGVNIFIYIFNVGGDSGNSCYHSIFDDFMQLECFKSTYFNLDIHVTDMDHKDHKLLSYVDLFNKELFTYRNSGLEIFEYQTRMDSTESYLVL